MTDKGLEIFRLVAELGSNSEAARVLDISQSSVSRAISSLESEFNTKLLNRDSIPFTVTSNGVILINLIDDGMSTKERFKRYIEEQSMKQLKISFAFPVSCSLFSSELSRFKQNEPSIVIKNYSGDTAQMRQMLVNGKLDVALLPERMNYCGYNTSKCTEELEWCLAAPNGVPLTDRSYICPDELMNLPLLVPADITSHSVIEKWVGDRERIHLSDTYNSIETLTEMLNRGYGAGFAPRLYSKHLYRYNIAFYLLSPKIFTPVYIYITSREDRLITVRPFIDLLKDKIK